MHTAAYRGRVCYASCVPKHLHYLLPCFLQYFYLILSCLICRNLTLPLFKKDVFVRNSYFPLNEISFCRHEINFFQLKLILRTKVRQKAIDFNQIESQVYSIFQYDTLFSNIPMQGCARTKVYFIFLILFNKLFNVNIYRVCVIPCCCYCYLMLLLLQVFN